MKKIINKTKFFVIEKLTGYEIIFISILLLISFFSFLYLAKSYIEKNFLAEKIIYTGNLNIGMTGILVNAHPYFAENQTDKSLSEFLYSDLKDFVSEKSFEKESGNYKISLSNKAFFQDKTLITSEDVIYSFDFYKQNKENLQSITIEKVSDREFYFKVSKDFQDLESLLDFKIVKKSNSENIASESLSTKTIGSGSFYIKSIDRDQNGIITKIQLARFLDKYPKAAYLDEINILFFPTLEQTSDAFLNKTVDLISGTPSENLLKNVLEYNGIQTIKSKTSEYFVLFLNQKNNDFLKSIEIRKYLNQSIDRELLVENVFSGLAETSYNLNSEKNSENTISSSTLKKAGFIFENEVLYKSIKESKQNKESKTPVTLTILTINNPEILKTAEFIKLQWQAKGVETKIETIEKSDIPNALREKKFDIFLFGFNIVDKTSYYSFFHSSQRTYPKLNISSYANKKVDSAVDKLRSENNPENIQNLLKTIQTELENDLPIIFLYKPVYTTFFFENSIYPKINTEISKTEEIYKDINYWYTNKEKILSFLSENKIIRFFEIYFY